MLRMFAEVFDYSEYTGCAEELTSCDVNCACARTTCTGSGARAFYAGDPIADAQAASAHLDAVHAVRPTCPVSCAAVRLKQYVAMHAFLSTT